LFIFAGEEVQIKIIYTILDKEEEALDITMKIIVKSGRQLEYY